MAILRIFCFIVWHFIRPEQVQQQTMNHTYIDKKLSKSLGWRTLPKAPSDGRLDSILIFSTVAAADRKCGPWCVRGWEPTGRTSGSHPSVEKTPPSHREPPPTTISGLLSPRWKMMGRVWNSLEQVQSLQKTRRQLSQVAQCGRKMSINLVFDGWYISSSVKVGSVPSGSRCLGRGFTTNPNPTTHVCGGQTDRRTDRQTALPKALFVKNEVTNTLKKYNVY